MERQRQYYDIHTHNIPRDPDHAGARIRVFQDSRTGTGTVRYLYSLRTVPF